MRLATLLVCLLLPLSSLFAGPAHAATAVSLQLKWRHAFQFAGYYAAQQQGYYREAGLEVDIRPGPPDSDPVQDVIAGRADFGIGTSGLVQSRAAGLPVQVLGVVLQHSPQILLTRADKPLHLLRERDSQPAMLEASSGELLAYLAGENIPPQTLHLLPHSGDVLDLASGRVALMSGYSSYEPFQLNQLGVPFHIYTPRRAGIDFYGDNLFASEVLTRSQPALAHAFWEASVRGWKYALAHREEVIDLILRDYAPDLSRAFLEFEAAEIIQLMQPDLIEVGYMTRERWQQIADTYARLGLVPPGFDVQPLLFQSAKDRQLQQVRNALTRTLIGAAMLVLLGIGVIVYIHRTNQRLRSTQTRLRLSESRYRMLTEEMKDVIWTVDAETLRFSYVSPSVQPLLGYSAEEVLQNGLPGALEAIKRVVQPGLSRFKAGDIASSGYETIDLELRHKNGHTLWAEVVCHLMHNPENQRIELQGITRDITERRRQQERIEHMAQHDALTGLANRSLFSEHFQQARAFADRDQHAMALIYMDLDKFKPVNDTCGHLVGDRLLCAVGTRINACVRGSDIVARIGGDEFLILLSRVRDASSALRVAQKIHLALKQPFEIDGHRLEISSSQGVALYPQHGSTEAELTKCADAAMYQAKNRGRSQVRLHRPNACPRPPSVPPPDHSGPGERPSPPNG
ncbi:Uncharacterised protein [uncultured Comamonas sp.]|nr:Uncharacterised protein [uncultured Comamonas sp.]